MNVYLLHKEIAEVCPIIGVAVGDESNKSTWRIDFDNDATEVQKSAAAAVIENYDISESEKIVINCGLVRFTVSASVLTTTDDTIGVDGVTRLSAGRYRIFYIDPDDDLLILPAPILRDAADVRCRVSAKTSDYTEIRVVNATGVAADAAEVTVMFSKVI